MIDLRTPQAPLNRADRRAELRAQMEIAGSVATALILAAFLIGGYAMLVETLVALPDLIAQSAARRAW